MPPCQAIYLADGDHTQVFIMVVEALTKLHLKPHNEVVSLNTMSVGRLRGLVQACSPGTEEIMQDDYGFKATLNYTLRLCLQDSKRKKMMLATLRTLMDIIAYISLSKQL